MSKSTRSRGLYCTVSPVEIHATIVYHFLVISLTLSLFILSTAITCDSCGGNCTGEVLKVQDKHFHIQCFTCKGEEEKDTTIPYLISILLMSVRTKC